MKARLITNGLLSILNGICWIIFIVSLVKFIHSLVGEVTYDDYGYSNYEEGNHAGMFATMGFIWIAIFLLSIGSLVMGIVTLCTEKHPEAQGLTIASGILSILGGAFFAGAIVSFIAVKKIS